MSPLARTSPASLRAALRRTPKQVRGFGLHPLKEHTAHHNMPFTYDNRRKFATRYAGAAATFFMIPFIAVGYQLRKSGGAA
ncbi:hypothetical protein C8Q73DRAFT_691137 [Cubamyces lactineus]|nr:hypothetical protein C8Q73DRAFT_691137 [Cubamyces lactineus]